MTLLTIDLNKPKDFVTNFAEQVNAMNTRNLTLFSIVLAQNLRYQIMAICCNACIEENYNSKIFDSIRHAEKLDGDIMKNLSTSIINPEFAIYAEVHRDTAWSFVTYLKKHPDMTPRIMKTIKEALSVHEAFPEDSMEDEPMEDEPVSGESNVIPFNT